MLYEKDRGDGCVRWILSIVAGFAVNPWAIGDNARGIESSNPDAGLFGKDGSAPSNDLDHKAVVKAGGVTKRTRRNSG